MAKIDKLQKQATEHLDTGETIEAAVLGAYETKMMGQDTLRNGIFAATPKRLVFYGKKLGGYELESFPYDKISSFEQGKGMTGGSVTFFASGNKAKMKYIKAGDLSDFVQIVRSRMGKQEPAQAATPAPTSESIPDQIRKLGELRNAGVLTEDEFEKKKAQLLDRM